MKMLVDIPGYRNNEIPKILKENNAKVGVELGVFEGEFSRILMENWDGVLYMIDPWMPLDDEEYTDYSNHKYNIDVFQKAMENIKGFEDRAFMLRSKGENIVNIFQDESLDFVYIDANHAYSYVKNDIDLWWPKLKKGGILSGHDYLVMDWYSDKLFHENGIDKHMWMKNPNMDDYKYAGIFGVNPAVDEFCEINNLSGKLISGDFTGSYVIIKP